MKLLKEECLVKIHSNKWMVIKPVRFKTPRNEVAIPIGFETDLCTGVPDCDWWLACLVHDWLYVQGEEADWSFWTKVMWRWKADMDLRWLIQQISKNPWSDEVAWLYYIGVRVFGLPVFWRKKCNCEVNND